MAQRAKQGLVGETARTLGQELGVMSTQLHLSDSSAPLRAAALPTQARVILLLACWSLHAPVVPSAGCHAELAAATRTSNIVARPPKPRSFLVCDDRSRADS